MTEAISEKRFLHAISLLTAAITNIRMYSLQHPQVLRYIEKAYSELTEILSKSPELTIFYVGEDIVVNRRPISSDNPNAQKFIKLLSDKGIERLTFLKGMHDSEMMEFIQALISEDLDIIRWAKSK